MRKLLKTIYLDTRQMRLYRRGWAVYKRTQGPQADTWAFQIIIGAFARSIGFAFVRSCNPNFSSSFDCWFGRRSWTWRHRVWKRWTADSSDSPKAEFVCSLWVEDISLGIHVALFRPPVLFVDVGPYRFHYSPEYHIPPYNNDKFPGVVAIDAHS